MEEINRFKKLLKDNRKTILAMKNIPETSPDIEGTLDNNDLLIDTLIRLFKNEKAQYLPVLVVDQIKHYIKDTTSHINNFIQQKTGGEHILTAMETLYAHCLQYGLITFGFNDKEAAQAVQNIRNQLIDVRRHIKQLGKKVGEKSTQLDTWSNEYKSQPSHKSVDFAL